MLENNCETNKYQNAQKVEFPNEAPKEESFESDTMTAWYRPAKKRSSRKMTAGALALCMMASGAFGFAGGIASDAIGAGGSDTEVLYKSVIRTSTDGSSTQPLTAADVAATVKPAVVEIKTEVASNSRFGQTTRAGAGSGVIISSDGTIVTNYHVISNAKSIAVRLADGKEYTAAVVGADSQSDLAVLKINASGLTPAILGDSSKLVVGEDAIAVGNPLGQLGGSVTEGIISALDRTITLEDGMTMSLLQTDASINPGNSGGGLFNLYGELVGIVNAKSSGSDVEGIGFAIPINTAKPIIEDLISSGYVKGRVGLGISVVEINDAFTAMQYQVNELGLYVAESSNSALKSGDRITSVGDTKISTLANLREVFSRHKAGDKVSVTLVRGGETMTVTASLVEIKS